MHMEAAQLYHYSAVTLIPTACIFKPVQTPYAENACMVMILYQSTVVCWLHTAHSTVHSTNSRIGSLQTYTRPSL